MKLLVGPFLLLALSSPFVSCEHAPIRGHSRPLRRRTGLNALDDAAKVFDPLTDGIRASATKLGDQMKTLGHADPSHQVYPPPDTGFVYRKQSAEEVQQHGFQPVHSERPSFEPNLQETSQPRPETSASFDHFVRNDQRFAAHTISPFDQVKMEITEDALRSQRERLDMLEKQFKILRHNAEEAGSFARIQDEDNARLQRTAESLYEQHAAELKQQREKLDEMQKQLDKGHGTRDMMLGGVIGGTIGLEGMMLWNNHKQSKKNAELADMNEQQRQMLANQGKQLASITGVAQGVQQNQVLNGYKTHLTSVGAGMPGVGSATATGPAIVAPANGLGMGTGVGGGVNGFSTGTGVGGGANGGNGAVSAA